MFKVLVFIESCEEFKNVWVKEDMVQFCKEVIREIQGLVCIYFMGKDGNLSW